MGFKYKRTNLSGTRLFYGFMAPDCNIKHASRFISHKEDEMAAGRFFKEGYYPAGVLLNPEMKRFKIFTNKFFYQMTPNKNPYDIVENTTYNYSTQFMDNLTCPPKVMTNILNCFSTASKLSSDPSKLCNFYISDMNKFQIRQSGAI